MYRIEKLNQTNALDIANNWKYDGEYSFYDITADVEDYEEFINEAARNENDHFQVYDGNKLVGFFCFIREENNLEIGLALCPDYCGKGLGQGFLEQIEIYAKDNYSFDKLQMSVATFNQRAIKVYHRCGFKDVSIENRETNGGIYEFLNLEKINEIPVCQDGQKDKFEVVEGIYEAYIIECRQ